MAGPPVIIIGAGLSGLVTAYELTKRDQPVLFLDQEPVGSLGGQAFWSLGGIFMVNSRQQRGVGVKDSKALAMADWLNTAGFDREREDYWPRRWAEAFVHFAVDNMEEYCKSVGMTFMSTPGWAERGAGYAGGHGNSIPRFHVTWGTGPEVVKVFADKVLDAQRRGLVEFRWRHRVDELVTDDTGRVVGARGKVLEDSAAARGVSTSRKELGDFEVRGAAVVVASGGIGGNVAKVKQNWPVDRLGPVPKNFVVGVPAHVDGRMLDISVGAGANIVNADRMWHYTEGLRNWNSIWPMHGIRVIPGPSSLWLDATGKRLPPPLFPGVDTLATLKHIGRSGHDYTWFVLNKSIVAREFALSGSEQNPDLTGKSYWLLLQRIFGSAGTQPVQDFVKHGRDFVVRDTLEELVAGMNALAADEGGPAVDYATVRAEVDARDSQLDHAFSKDHQLMLINNARLYWPDKRRVAAPHRLLDARHGPLIAVKMNLLTRKSLGGLETDLAANAVRADGERVPGLYAVGEAAGFGGGGVHGYSALEGTFLGGCIFTGWTAGRAIAEQLQGRGKKR